jgi:small subunit ribosomal protein S1
MKQVAGDPWDTVADRIHKGDVIKGIVTNLTDFGAFVEIEDGIEGLVHVGDISWTRIK